MKHRFAILLLLVLPATVLGQSKPAYPPLPAAVSSLGAVVCDGHLYVYGGHAGKTHSYDTKAVLGTFHRLKLDGGTKWEELPGGTILQGMNLATHGGKVYRVGGMQPRNEPGSPADNHSVADAAVFDPKTGKWEKLPSLPQGRSSHDVLVAKDTLVVVGGWTQKGAGEKSEWLDTALTLDLAAAKPEWKAVKQPFQRRALTATAVGTKVYVLGGLDATANALNRVEIYDLASGKWSTGPDFPGGRVGFSPAANTVNGRLILNTSEGTVYRLTEDGTAWEKVGAAATKRMVARLLPHGSSALLVGGASRNGNIGKLEVLTIAEHGEKVVANAK
jgi:N-acetylneuraminic acid mutarotase